MEENIVNKDKNKKKIIIGSIVIVLLLLVVVIGSTYAYFSLNVNGDGTNTKVTITTGSSNQIKLSGGLQDFHIKLEVKDMAYNRQGDYYATSDKNLNYEKDKENALTEIGRVEVIGELEERHTCTASANVTLSGSMASLIQKGDLELSLQSEHYSNTSDLTDISNGYPATLTFILDNDTKPIEAQLINAYLKFTNRNIDQSYLAGQTLNVSIIIEDFKCTTDTKAPEISNFYINKNEEENYTNQINNTAYITWEDEDVSEYCITNKEGSNNCTSWDKVEGNQVQKQIELTDTEGEQTYYVYLKDKANNISTGNRYATIVYDKTAPSITDVQVPNPQETSLTLNITGNDTKEVVNRTSGIDKYCYSESDSTNEGDYTCDSNSSITISGLQSGTSYTYYIYAKDKAGNSGITNRQQYTFKTKIPGLAPYNALTQTTTGTYLKTVADKDELLRYVGTKDDVTKENIKNFICFGTDNKETCLANKNTYMYRIIGITTENVNQELGLVQNQLKIIKAVPPSDGTSIKWASDYSWNYDWDYEETNNPTTATYGPTARWYLNNDFLETITGMVGTHQWSDLISNPQWYKGDYDTNSSNMAKSLLTKEKSVTTTNAYKIGLMYASDYYNSGIRNTTNWLHITNGMTGNLSTYSSTHEWTQTRYGYSRLYLGWYIFYSGTLNTNGVNTAYAVRPVFYLIPNITLTGGGTESDPFIIHAE